MKKKNIVFVAIIMISLTVGAIIINRVIKNKEEEKRLAGISEAYVQVNNAFGIGNIEYYESFPSAPYAIDGTKSSVYLCLEYYRQQTGVELYYEDVMVYFSQEYEEDGSLRLYNSGLHTEIEAYIEWKKEHLEELNGYVQEIEQLFSVYFFEHKDEGFENFALYELSREMLDELIKKEADPTYEMDLMSIQQRERAEAEAQEAT
jgi:hypothetical protein